MVKIEFSPKANTSKLAPEVNKKQIFQHCNDKGKDKSRRAKVILEKYCYNQNFQEIQVKI